MVERALPAVLELAARDEDDIGLLEPGHVSLEVAVVPRALHRLDDREDRRGVGLRARRGGAGDEQEREGQSLHGWNWPTMTVWQRPPRMTRSPSSRQWITPLRRLAWSAVNSFRPSFSAQ